MISLSASFSENQINTLLAPASVFKDGFSIDWLIHITDQKASKILKILEQGVFYGILIKSDFSYFQFSDKSVQDQLNKVLTSLRKAAIHHKISDLLSKIKKDDVETARLISGFFLETDNEPESCERLSKAGDIYLKTANRQEASLCYLKALDDLSRFKSRSADELYIDIAIKLSRISGPWDELNKILNILQSALLKASVIKDSTLTARLHMQLAKIKWFHADYPKAINQFQAGQRILKKSEDFSLKRAARCFGLFFHYWQGAFKETVSMHKAQLSETKVSFEDNFDLMAESVLGNCYLMTGEAAQGLGIISAAGSQCKKQGDPFLNAFNNLMMAGSLLEIYQVNEALDYIQQVKDQAIHMPDDPVLIHCHLLSAYAHYIDKNSQLAIQSLKEFIKKRALDPKMAWPFPYMLKLCWAIELEHLPQVSGISLRQEIENSLKSENPFMIGIALRYEAFLQQKNKASSKTVYRLLRESVKWLEKTGHLVELNRTRRILINQYLLDGDEKTAKKIHGTAVDELSRISRSLIPYDLKPLLEEEPVYEQQMENLFFLTQRFMDAKDDNMAANQLLIGACRLIGAERGAVFLADNTDDVSGFSLAFSNNLTDEQLLEPGFDFAKKTISSVIQTGTDVIKARIPFSGPENNEPIRSLICLALKLKGISIGAVYYDNRFIPHAFTDENIMALKQITALMTLVMEKLQKCQEPACVEKKADAETPENIINSLLSLKEVERNHIRKALDITGWKVRGAGNAAELLDIHPSTLYSRMKKLGISKKNPH